MLYPLFIVVTVCLLLAMMLSVMVPQFGWLDEPHFWPFDRLSGVPWALGAIAILLPAVVLVAFAAWWWRSGRVGGASAAGFGALGRLPWVRRVNYWGQAAAMADVLRLLLERGLPLDRSLRLAADATGDAQIRSIAANLADRAQQGFAALRSQPAGDEERRSGFPNLIGLALRHAGDRQLMAASLQQASDLYRERAIRAAEWYAEAVPILVTIGIGGTLSIAFTLFVIWPYASALHELAQWNWK
jgi:type II secretory pathway component PulF